MEDIFREELKDIKQFWGSKKNNSKRPHRMSVCFALGKVEKWQIDSKYICKSPNVRKRTHKHFFSKLFLQNIKRLRKRSICVCIFSFHKTINIWCKF